MDNQIKSGKDVIDEFFAEILNVEGTDESTVNKLIELYGDNKFTDSNIQNALEELKLEAIKPKKIKEDGEN
tara:strand:- start:2394 stop:2606 length:213 start_codon:yes stop_codon:yes gene_type:complete